jgi:hypothetical protein
MRQIVGLFLLLAACGGGAAAVQDGGGSCGPNTCGACKAGSVPNDGCAGGVWICTCIANDMNASVIQDLAVTDLATSPD